MAITTRNSVFTARAKGNGWHMPCVLASSQASTGAGANSGFLLNTITFNSIGSTLPGTIQGIPLPPGLPNQLYVNFAHFQAGASAKGLYLAYFYKLGTLDLANAAAAPYDGFTHDAAWSGTINRTILGAATQPLQLIPLLHITTATTTTAPAFKLQTTTGPGNGYVNQAGSNVIGTKTFTLPSAATAAGSSYILRLEDGDSAVQDMTQISVTTKGATGAATVWGVEILASGVQGAGKGGLCDSMFGGFCMNNLAPAVPTSGTLTSALGVIHTGGSGASSGICNLVGVLNA